MIDEDQLADDVLATLDGVGADTLRAFSDGLRWAEGPAFLFGQAVSSLATNRELGHEGWLPTLQMKVALQSAWRTGFAEQIEDAESPFWIAVREALDQLAATHV